MNTETSGQLLGTLPQTVEIETIANPHSHLREGCDVMGSLILNCIKGGVDVLGPMPNTSAGLTTAEEVRDYIQYAQLLEGDETKRFSELTYIPIVMLTEQTTEKQVDDCVEAGIRDGKIYPYLRTTKSARGVRQWGKMLPIVKHCGKVGMKVHGHFEHPAMTFDNRDAEFVCLPIVYQFLEETDATIVWEHGTDARCIPHWKDMAESKRFFVTLTAHHLATNEDRTFGDVRAVCKPPIKTERDRQDLVALVSENHPWVMAGADDAPHDVEKKHVHEDQCACGAYTAPFLAQLYAHALEPLFVTARGLETFINFTSRNARVLHNLPDASRKITLLRKSFVIPKSYRVGSWTVEPFWAGRTLNWSMKN